MSNERWKIGLLFSALLLASANAFGQAATIEKPPAATQTDLPPVVTQAQTGAPPVVTVVHRLSGLTLLRLLRLRSRQMSTVATINDSFRSGNEVHTTIVAGLALDDGQTIAARLPQVVLELPAIQLLRPRVESPNRSAPGDAASSAQPSRRPQPAPDVAVLLRDGKELPASFVGLDGATGLSVLKVAAATFSPAIDTSDETLFIGQPVRLLSPEPAPEEKGAPGTVFVRVGQIEAKLAQINRAPSGKLERVTARSANLSPALVGGIVLDDKGATVGIVEAVAENDARILPAAVVRSAARRVLERKSSVPRPLLGVRGEALEFVPRTLFLAKGWRPDETAKLVQKRAGIFVRSVLPRTPAALARLRSGDIIVRVNNSEVRTAEAFSALLAEIGSSAPVRFTVLRPNRKALQSITLTLSGDFFDPSLEPQPFEAPEASATADPLAAYGLESLGLGSGPAGRFGVPGGLLVVFVQPESPAYRAGVRAGDLIISIDDRAASQAGVPFNISRSPQRKHLLTIVRDRDRIQVTIHADEVTRD